MEALEALKRTIHVTEELHSLVKTMKVLAGLNIRLYERAARAVAEYNRTVEMGLQIALRGMSSRILPPASGPGGGVAVIVFGSDQGMCGQLNDVVVEHALKVLCRLGPPVPPRAILAVGQRAATELEEAGYAVEEALEVPGSTGGISETVHEALRRIERWRAQGIARVVLFYCRPYSGAFYRACSIRLLPVDARWIRGLQTRRWPTRVIPTYTMETQRLYHSLIGEYLFVSLFRAFAESLASENMARLASMQVAERNIEERLKELSGAFRQSRQSSITSELLDIVSAFEALKGKVHAHRGRAEGSGDRA
jgi:F-type H+-transporting ATPase subunit gamma